MKAIQARDVAALRDAIAQGASVEPRPDAADSPIGLAVRSGEPAIVETLLAAGAQVAPRCLADAPLTIAAERGDLALVDRLLDAGADVDYREEDGSTALHAAAFAGKLQVVRRLIERGAALGIGESPVLAAAAGGHPDVVEFLSTQVGPEVSAAARRQLENQRRRRSREMPRRAAQRELDRLFAACAERDLVAVARIIDRGVDPNARDLDSGTTPLIAAAVSPSSVDVVDLLLKRGADPNVADDAGKTALSHSVTVTRNAEVVRRLLACGADVEHRDDRGRTPLMQAAEYGRIESVERLLEAGAEINARDPHGISALMLAVREGGWRHQKVSELLRSHGASEDGIAPEPLIDAVKRSDAVAVGRLLQAGVDPDRTDAWGESAMLLAIREARPEIVRLLLDAGADPNRPTPESDQLPLDWAISAGSEPIVRLLIERGARVGNCYVVAPPSAGEAPSPLARLVRLCVELGVDVRGRRGRGRSAG